MTTTRFTGFRITLAEPSAQAALASDLRQKIVQLAPLMVQIAKEPYFLDDALRRLSPEQILSWGLDRGEIFVKFVAGAVAGYIMLRDIIPGRSATMEAWAHPEFRRSISGQRILAKFAREIYAYAFRPFSDGNIGTDGLGLLKIRAEISLFNRGALRSAMAQGFEPLVTIPFDAFFGGVPSPMVLLELYAPSIRAVQVQGIMSHGQEASISTPSTDVHAATADATTSGSDTDAEEDPDADAVYLEGGYTSADWEPGEHSRVEAAAALAAHLEHELYGPEPDAGLPEVEQSEQPVLPTDASLPWLGQPPFRR